MHVIGVLVEYRLMDNHKIALFNREGRGRPSNLAKIERKIKMGHDVMRSIFAVDFINDQWTRAIEHEQLILFNEW